ncbi:hypothetical protein ACLE20_08885 [Rhizobium sp. YIM 134829]|uniref:hypothetical protein n=1 Tax=Rhizobium sp. YIM 134829 TaxID=3390453 RepID=UPI00397ADA7D
MTILKDAATQAAPYVRRIDPNGMSAPIQRLITEVIATALSVDVLKRALGSGLTQVASILRAIPVAEGRLLERGIRLVAGSNPDLIVLTDNLRLPVTKAATEIVAMNEPTLVRSLSLDADQGGRKSYTPDLLILHRRTGIAHLVDVKRSLGSYEVSRIAELKQRMLAASLVVPDLLYKEHRRLHVAEVRVVILNAENQRSDIDNGVWPLTDLDHLVEIAGAGHVIEELRGLFRDQVEANWGQAIRAHCAKISSICPSVPTPSSVTSATTSLSNDRPADHDARATLTIGFARSPRLASG